MKKGIVLSTLASALLLTSVDASQLLDRLEKLEGQMQKLQKENKQLKSSIQSNYGYEIEDLGERLDEVETRSFTDRIQFGLGFKTRVENFKRQMADGTSSTDSNIWSSKVMLNMRSQISDDMKFSGRLSMNKYWADGSKHALVAQDAAQGRMPSDSTLYVERAYIDWTLNEGSSVPVTLTIGRQPSSDGPSYTYMDDTTRKSTYSALAFDGSTDGLVATINLSKVTGIAGTALRVAYGKGFQDDDRDNSNMTSFIGVDSQAAVDDTNVGGVFLDSTIPAMPGSLLQIGYVTAKDLINSANMQMVSGASIVPVAPTTLGDLSVAVALLELPNISKSGLDFFVQYAQSKAESNGRAFQDPSTGMYYGLLDSSTTSTVAGDTKNGSAIWTGVRYTLPMKNQPKIGFEYNKGSKNWMSFTWGAHDTYNKLATRGSAYELYYIQPINKYSFIRAGMVAMDYKYTGSGVHVGAPTAISDLTAAQKTQVLDKLTNYYVQFNLLY
jgi:hypothetical protein